jgi:hypothetical protein
VSQGTIINPNVEVVSDLRDEEPYGILAEFGDIDTLVAACEKVRDAGYRKWEAYTPFPVHGLDTAMGHEPTKLPWIVLACGLTGMISGVILVWWTNGNTQVDVSGLPYAIQSYPFIVSGKPFFSLPANIPPIFELTILFSAFGAFFGMLAMNLLPRFWHPVFQSPRFDRATQDRFFIAIDATDPRYDRAHIEQALRAAGATDIEVLSET